MTVEAAAYISQLVATNPADSDEIPEGDNHLRLLKSCLLNSFSGLGAGAVTVTFTQINTIPDLAPKASPTFTGTPVAPTAALATSTTQIATTAFVQTAIAAVNAQSTLTFGIDSGVAVTGVVGQHTACTNVAAVTFTMPASPTAGQRTKVMFCNGLFSNIIDPGAEKLKGLSGTKTVNAFDADIEFTYVNASYGWGY